MIAPYAEVIGDPIDHSKSPPLHNFWLAKLGLAADYRAERVAMDGLAAYLAMRREDPAWLGCSVTAPHKQAIIPFLDVVDDSGIGAVNCVIPRQGQLIGCNTDGTAVLEALPPSAGTDAPVCLIGAGGAARAAVASLAILGVRQLHIIVRDPSKGRMLLETFGMTGELSDFEEAEAALSGCAGLINASPLGMTGSAPMPKKVLEALAKLRRQAFVFDMIYSPLRTQLLEQAGREGLREVDGLTMLIGQAKEAFFHFFDVAAPAGWEPELRALLTK